MDIQIAKVTHFYDKIGVAIVEIQKQPLRVGDTVRISGHDSEFTQVVTSLQEEHRHIDEAEPGEIVGIKMERPVKTGDMIYLVTQKI